MGGEGERWKRRIRGTWRKWEKWEEVEKERMGGREEGARTGGRKIGVEAKEKEKEEGKRGMEGKIRRWRKKERRSRNR